MYLVTHRHLWSCDKDGGHTIRSATVENPTLNANFMVLSPTELDLLPIRFTPWEWEILRFFVPMILGLTRWPSYTNLTHNPSACTIIPKMELSTSRLSKVITLHTDIHAATKTIHHATSRVANNNNNKNRRFTNTIFYQNNHQKGASSDSTAVPR